MKQIEITSPIARPHLPSGSSYCGEQYKKNQSEATQSTDVRLTKDSTSTSLLRDPDNVAL